MKLLDNIKKNTIVLFIATVIILFIVLKDDFHNIIDTLMKMNIKYVLLAVFFYLLSVSLKGLVNYFIIHDPEKVSIREAIKHNLITQFFNGVTPFASGGQPMEIYMLTEHKISLTRATNYTLQSFLLYQIALVLCGFIAVFYNSVSGIFNNSDFLQKLVLLGFIINIIVVLVLVSVSFSKTAIGFIKKIVKKVNRKLKHRIDEEKIEKTMQDFYNTSKDLKKNKKLFLMGIFLNMLSLICLYITPLFVVYGMHNFMSLSWLEAITASAYVYIIGSCVPIPGGTGGIEYGFTQFFGAFIFGKELQAALICWRAITYYFGMIIGALLFNFEKKVQK